MNQTLDSRPVQIDMVTQAHGLDSAQYTFRYVAGWASQAATDDATIADVVAQTGARVIGAVEKILTSTMAGRPDPELAIVDELARDVGVGSAAIPTGTVDSSWEVVTHVPLTGDQPSSSLPGQRQWRSLTP